ncbi:sister chromatid cohesion protein DCC1 [Trypanosoma conorhini]|uniref:Sister chromatid cohesion protein DCC1 n=1 Tax=Trypanosoma conorhini TaxID=83891 RepID=A0A422P9T1_9TRYP|nr:sister chromatid cohesion protein DCC1 [Trypanosoma conorhini]RNF14463.1 sister chromatid cohesion protein DCC1 [Trypanosoma conorhini]
MSYVTLRSDFAACSEYRLLALEAECVHGLKERLAAQGPAASATAAAENGTTLLMMKGTSQLLLCDDRHTYRLRRVEYSNTLLLAEERPMCERDSEALKGASALGGSAPSRAEATSKHVVISAAERLFEAKRSCAYRDALRLIKAVPVTIEELESEYGQRPGGCAAGTTALPDGIGGSQRYTFPQLVSMSQCSAGELSDMLSDAGAIVVHGRVRLLHPSLLREALKAVIVFMEGCEELSWGVVEKHFCPSVYPSIVIRVVQRVYGALTRVEGKEGAAALLNMQKVLAALAEAAIVALAPSVGGEEVRPQGRGDETPFFSSVDFESFYSTWMDSVPSSFFASGEIPPLCEPAAFMSLLHAVVIVRGARGDGYAGATVVWAPQDELATDLSRRIEQLFELNPGRWEAEAFRAYVEPLLDPGVTLEQVVHRHAKEFHTPNQPVRYGRLA